MLMPTERLEGDQYTRLILTVDSTFWSCFEKDPGEY